MHTTNNILVHYNLGSALAEQNKLDAAIEQYRQALRINPNYARAHNNLGVALAKQNKLTAAIKHYQQAFQIDPNYARAYNNLGSALAQQGKLDEAIRHFRQALQIDPDCSQAHFNLSSAFKKQGKFDTVIEHYQQALQSNPEYTMAKNNLAWMLATCPDATLRDGKRAVELAKQAVRLTNREDPSVLDTLAAAYAEAGRYPEAIETARRAIDIAKSEAVAKDIRDRLKLYQASIPYHEKWSENQQ